MPQTLYCLVLHENPITETQKQQDIYSVVTAITNEIKGIEASLETDMEGELSLYLPDSPDGFALQLARIARTALQRTKSTSGKAGIASGIVVMEQPADNVMDTKRAARNLALKASELSGNLICLREVQDVGELLNKSVKEP